jgi:cardiolipin synthase
MVSMDVLASSFAPLRSRDAEWSARCEMIHRARRFLYSSTYYVGPDAIGEDVLGDLGDAAQRGVRTTLVIDRFGQWLGASAWGPRENRLVNRWLARAADRGVRIVWTAPASWTRTLVGGGHHVKIQVCESGPALFASSNLSRHSFEVWGEFAALLDGPVVQTLLTALQAVIPDPGDDRADPRSAGVDPLKLQWWWCDPSADATRFAPLRRGRRNPITDGLVRSIEAAQSSVAISSFYVKPEPSLRAAILDAARRGVAVDVFHSGPDALGGAETPWLAAALDYPELLDAGVAVHEMQGGEHSKLVLVDDRLAVFGSYNLDHAAHDVVAEAMFATEDPRVVVAVASVFESLRRDPGCERVWWPTQSWGARRHLHAQLTRPLRRWL